MNHTCDYVKLGVQSFFTEPIFIPMWDFSDIIKLGAEVAWRLENWAHDWTGSTCPSPASTTEVPQSKGP